MKHKPHTLHLSLLLISLVGVSAPALALSSDTRMPVHIESQQQSLDLQNNIVTFTGNVVLTQGSIKIRADNVVITRKNGKRGKEMIDGYGKPATFYQMQDDGKPIQGHASHMRYEVEKEQIILNGSAFLQQLDSSITGDKITYLVKQQKMQAMSSPGKRVTTILLPSQLSQSQPQAQPQKPNFPAASQAEQ